jgi:hypothetical protein
MSEPFPPAEIHFSRLKLMALSPAHFKAAEELNEETPARRMGSLVHALVLGGDLIVFDGARTGNAWKSFKALIAGEPFLIFDGPHRGKAWEAVRDRAAEDGSAIVTSADLEAAERGRAVYAKAAIEDRRVPPIVSIAEYDRANACAEVVRRHPLAAELLLGERECGLQWRFLNRDCAGHLDVLGPLRVVEVKTSALAEPMWFQRQAIRMGYHGQCAWYREGARQNGFAIGDCFVIAIEVRPPFAVTCLRLTDRALEEGEKLCRIWMERLLTCEAANVWPEYVQSIVELDVPGEVDLIFGEEAA